MKRRYSTLSIAALLLLTASLAGDAFAQRSRSVSDPSDVKKSAPPSGTTTATTAVATTTTAAPVPQNMKVKYEGGLLGYNKKQTGTLNFDDESSRLVFRDKEQKEYISIPYKAIAAAYADTKSRRPTAATVIGSMPTIFALPARFVRKKYRYLTMQFNDPDAQVQGVMSFKVDNKEMLTSILEAVARKAELTPRGEAYVRLDKSKEKDQDK